MNTSRRKLIIRSRFGGYSYTSAQVIVNFLTPILSKDVRIDRNLILQLAMQYYIDSMDEWDEDVYDSELMKIEDVIMFYYGKELTAAISSDMVREDDTAFSRHSKKSDIKERQRRLYKILGKLSEHVVDVSIFMARSIPKRDLERFIDNSVGEVTVTNASMSVSGFIFVLEDI